MSHAAFEQATDATRPQRDEKLIGVTERTRELVVGVPLELQEGAGYRGPEVARPVLHVLGPVLWFTRAHPT